MWGVVFALDPLNFWVDITGASLLLAAVAVYYGRDELKGLFFYRPGMFVAAMAGAVFLYVIFVIGGWASRELLPFAAQQIADVYEIRGLAPSWAMAVLLAIVIAPCEELFWRGYVQSALTFQFDDVRGWLLTALAYALVHIWSWNLMLVASALVVGLFWGYLFYRYKSLLPALISHVLWDLAVFVYYPILQ